MYEHPRHGRRGLLLAMVALSVLSMSASGCKKASTPTVTGSVSTATSEPTSPAPTQVALADIAIELTKVADGFDQPLYVVGPDDGSGRLFVVEKTGRVRIVKNGSVLPTPFLDISALVSTDSERGLLGLAFAPDFADNGHFYIDYTDKSGTTTIARYTVSSDSDVADATSEEVLLRIAQPFSNHNGGCVQFDADGMLVIGMGDGGSGGDPNGNAQNPQVLLGKILRIDVGESGTPANGEPYGIPADNPWANPASETDPLPEIWALGVRNPWRYSFDRTTGDLWIGDVGQNLYEEIDFVPASKVAKGGLDFGWNVFEATHPYPPGSTPPADSSAFTMPVIEYGHKTGESVTGGYVYRGTEYPTLEGVYFYGDYVVGKIWAARESDGSVETREMLSTGGNVVSFGEDAAGALYVIDFGGTVYKLTAK